MKYDIEYIRQFAESKNGKLLSDEYVSTKKLKWLCNVCSCRWEANFYSVHNKGTWCPSCANPHASRQRQTHTCHECKQEFVSTRKDTKFCSRLCYRKTNKETYDNNTQQYKAKRDCTPYHSRLNIIKGKSKRLGFESNLTLEYYISLITKPCFYCKTEIKEKHGISLDRLNPDLGYTIENVVQCCGSCNQIRNIHLTHEEMIVAMNAVIVFRNKPSP